MVARGYVLLPLRGRVIEFLLPPGRWAVATEALTTDDTDETGSLLPIRVIRVIRVIRGQFSK